MSTDLVLKRAVNGANIDRSSVARALAEISATDGLQCALAADGSSILISVSLPLADSRSAGIDVSIEEDGTGLTGSTRGGGGPLLYWCLHALAARLECRLFDPQTGGRPKANSQRYLADAKALTAAHEREVLADEPYSADNDESEDEGGEASKLLVGFLKSLVAVEQLSLTGDVSEVVHLAPQLSDPSELYEALLESPLVDELFVSESEFVLALAVYRRR